jgi:hypothetical protein
VAVEGPLVDVIRFSARREWSKVAWSYFRKGTVRGVALPVSTSAGGHMTAAFLVRDNIRHRRDIETAYMRAIEQAESEIIPNLLLHDPERLRSRQRFRLSCAGSFEPPGDGLYGAGDIALLRCCGPLEDAHILWQR